MFFRRAQITAHLEGDHFARASLDESLEELRKELGSALGRYELELVEQCAPSCAASLRHGSPGSGRPSTKPEGELLVFLRYYSISGPGASLTRHMDERHEDTKGCPRWRLCARLARSSEPCEPRQESKRGQRIRVAACRGCSFCLVQGGAHQLELGMVVHSVASAAAVRLATRACCCRRPQSSRRRPPRAPGGLVRSSRTLMICRRRGGRVWEPRG